MHRFNYHAKPSGMPLQISTENEAVISSKNLV